jgi:hypothetical protein
MKYDRSSECLEELLSDIRAVEEVVERMDKESPDLIRLQELLSGMRTLTGGRMTRLEQKAPATGNQAQRLGILGLTKEIDYAMQLGEEQNQKSASKPQQLRSKLLQQRLADAEDDLSRQAKQAGRKLALKLHPDKLRREATMLEKQKLVGAISECGCSSKVCVLTFTNATRRKSCLLPMYSRTQSRGSPICKAPHMQNSALKSRSRLLLMPRWSCQQQRRSLIRF